MTRIVQLTTYPLKTPRHGGQLRCAAIRGRYRECGFEVETIAFIHGSDYRASDHERNDIVLPPDHPVFDPRLPRFSDLHTGRLIAVDAYWMDVFSRTLDGLSPDIVALEQPWLFPPLERWMAERRQVGAPTPKLVYSSQNIEWKLKRDEGDPSSPHVALERGEVEEARLLECAVVRVADLIVACTEEELAELRAMADNGNAQQRFVVARNAIAPFSATPAQIDAVKRKHGLDHYPLFVGSAHPPNADGFWSMLAPSLAFLRPGERIVVAGGVGHILRQHRLYSAWSGINEPRLAIVGEVDRAELDALLLGAAVILLPITTGGGSNLKTAEAIYSGRPTLATPHALRGYEGAMKCPTIEVANDCCTYRRVLRNMLDVPQKNASISENYPCDLVTWEISLTSLESAMYEFKIN